MTFPNLLALPLKTWLRTSAQAIKALHQLVRTMNLLAPRTGLAP